LPGCVEVTASTQLNGTTNHAFMGDGFLRARRWARASQQLDRTSVKLHTGRSRASDALSG